MFAVKILVSILATAIIFGVLLFVPAGTIDWPRGWAFLGLITLATVAMMLYVFPGNEALLDERLKPGIQKEQPLADKVMVVLVFLTFSATVIVIPLDVLRFRWLPEPAPTVRYFGLFFFLTGWWIMTVALKENSFAAPVVKHQADRHQTVVDQGPYRIVRHPMYAGAVLFLIGMPLWLGSYAATLVATLAIAVLAVRAVFEERFLQRELQGYAAYTSRVRYRIVPFVW